MCPTAQTVTITKAETVNIDGIMGIYLAEPILLCSSRDAFRVIYPQDRSMFRQETAGVWRNWGLAAEHLDVELIKSAVMRDAEHSIATMQALREIGLKLSLTDLGAGYSSLSQLKRSLLDNLQGYYVTRPMPAAEFAGFAREHHFQVAEL